MHGGCFNQRAFDSEVIILKASKASNEVAEGLIRYATYPGYTSVFWYFRRPRQDGRGSGACFLDRI